MPPLLYDPAAGSYLRLLLRWRHTFIPRVTRSPILYLLLGSYAATLLRQQTLLANGGMGLPELNWKIAQSAHGLLVFFLVFYSSHGYKRLIILHGHTVGIGGSMFEFAYLVRTHMGNLSPALKWNVMRLMLGAMQVHYAFLSASVQQSDDDDGSSTLRFEITRAEWEAMHTLQLLTASEIESLIAYRGMRSFLPIVWAMEEVKSALKIKHAGKWHADADEGERKEASEAQGMLIHNTGLNNIYMNFERAALAFRGHCGQMVGTLQMPIPFGYFHLMRLTLTLSLTLTGYAMVGLTPLEEDLPAFASEEPSAVSGLDISNINGTLTLSFLSYSIICFIMLGVEQMAVE
jgi:hypothetical protein